MRIVALVLGAGLSLFVLLGLAAWATYRNPKPEPLPGSGDALAETFSASVDAAAWEKVGAIRWTHAGRVQHLWDRARQFDRIRYGETEVLLDVAGQRGVGFAGGQRLTGDAEDRAVRRALKLFYNDTFWLMPLAKLFDPGVTRTRVRLEDGSEGLLVHYASGGATPGDSYVWLPGAERPRGWRMWTSIVPIGGIEVSFEGWVRLPAGPWVSTQHRVGFYDFALTDLVAAESLAELEPVADPFAALVVR